jgi:hypothetical protein
MNDDYEKFIGINYPQVNAVGGEMDSFEYALQKNISDGIELLRRINGLNEVDNQESSVQESTSAIDIETKQVD